MIATHVVTLVNVEIDGTRILTLQDLFFNLRYLGLDEKPLELFTLLRLLKARRHDAIRVECSPGGFSRFFQESGEIRERLFSLAVFLKERATPFLDALEGHGFPKNLLYLLASRLSISAPEQPELMRLRAGIAQALGVDESAMACYVGPAHGRIDGGTAVNLGTMERTRVIDAVQEVIRIANYSPRI